MVNFDKFEEQIFLNTVRIENLTDKELGTGFMLQVKYDEKSVRHLLFSNKHVFWGKKDYQSKTYLKAGLEKELQITVHKNKDDGTYSVGNVQNLKIKLNRDTKGYFENATHDIDVACLNISEAYNHYKINTKSAELNQFNNYKLDQIYAGQKVIFVGYPTGFYDEKNFLPVLRTGFIASIPEIDFNGLPQILLDAQVFPGSSGSPVFIEINGQYKLLGIINAARFSAIQFLEIPHMAAVESEKDSPIQKQKIPVQPIGLGMLFKMSVINDICSSLPKV